MDKQKLGGAAAQRAHPEPTPRGPDTSFPTEATRRRPAHGGGRVRATPRSSHRDACHRMRPLPRATRQPRKACSISELKAPIAVTSSAEDLGQGPTPPAAVPGPLTWEEGTHTPPCSRSRAKATLLPPGLTSTKSHSAAVATIRTCLPRSTFTPRLKAQQAEARPGWGSQGWKASGRRRTR